MLLFKGMIEALRTGHPYQDGCCTKELTMTDNPKQTSKQAASAAGEVLRDEDATSADKKAAGSALSQTPSKPKSGN
jgi:hypothetical protein